MTKRTPPPGGAPARAKGGLMALPSAPRLTLAPDPAQATPDPARATPEPDREKLRADVRHLVDQGLSNRAIASRLPVSKDSVARWRKEWSTPMSQETAPEATPDAPPAEPPAPDHEPDAPPEQPAQASDPARLTVPLDDAMRRNLALLAAVGMSERDAVAESLKFVADGIRIAWRTGVVPRGALPQLHVSAYPTRTPPAPAGPNEG